MQRTRIAVKLLVGVAVTAVSGCVSVEHQPGHAPRPETSRPARDLAPQIARPPVRDTLESLPDPKPSAQASETAPGALSDTRRTGQRTRQGEHPGGVLPRPRQAPRVAPAPVPAMPASPVTGADVCALGRGYGGWPAGSTPSRICEDSYGH
ncbi:hypothetical protein [Streptomyces sp. NBC_00316]|uniref:hypothetical protein n=1 Tax=Streptomyces sp. NBC_00316 TaxID=2975710 RepID=UPI002E2D8511|nr:hypothetical protein [Streptomyces sp. NBC_00316]